MKFFGNAHLQQNYLQEAVIPLDTSFPVVPKVGQIVFKDRILYICVEITTDGMPIWVPLTQQLTTFTYVQSTPSAQWVIGHDLNTSDVSVTLYDTANRIIIPNEVTIDSASQVTVDFGVGATGKAVILSGHMEGQQPPTYAYEFFQTTPSSTWVIDHGLGRYPIVRVFVGNQEVQPASITFTTANTVTVTFNTPQVGQAKLI